MGGTGTRRLHFEVVYREVGALATLELVGQAPGTSIGCLPHRRMDVELAYLRICEEAKAEIRMLDTSGGVHDI